MNPPKAAGPREHPWEFRRRFRRGAFGWRSKLPVERVKQAVSEIKRVARRDPQLGAEGAVLFLERVSGAIERVDGSSGAIGSAVNRAVDALVPIIARAPADPPVREAWLERLFEAHAADEIPYIEGLADHWGELCGSKELASEWADRLIESARLAVAPDRLPGTFFHGTSACLSALYRAGRYEELVALVGADTLWDYQRWAVRALADSGKKAEAIRLAESCRGPWTPERDVDAVCEEILYSSGLIEEAYRRYGLLAHRRGTYLATFRATARRYPDVPPERLLADLVETTPGEEGKWFAAARSAGLYEEALALAERSPCDPKTLTRAARDLAEEQPEFAARAGLLALHWLAEGYGYEITPAHVRTAYQRTMEAATRAGTTDDTRRSLREILEREPPQGFVGEVLRREIGP